MAPLPKSRCVLYQETRQNIGRYKYGTQKIKHENNYQAVFVNYFNVQRLLGHSGY